MQKETARKQQEEEAWYRQQQLLLDAEEKRRRMIQTEEQKLVDQRKRLVLYYKQLCGCIMSHKVMPDMRQKQLWYMCELCPVAFMVPVVYDDLFCYCVYWSYMYCCWIKYTINNNITKLYHLHLSRLRNAIIKQKLYLIIKLSYKTFSLVGCMQWTERLN